MQRCGGRRRAPWVAGVLAAVWTSWAVPAAAHPFGPPPVAEVVAEAHDVTVRWTAAVDDYAALGVAAGVLDDTYGTGVADPAPDDVGDRLGPAARREVEGSADVRQHVTDRVRVVQHGQACPVAAVDVAQLFVRGATVRVTCPEPVETVDVTLMLLSDVHPAYRTVAVAGGPAIPARTMYTADRSTVRWDFGAAGTAAPTTMALLRFGVVGALLAAGVGVLVWRRRGAVPA